MAAEEKPIIVFPGKGEGLSVAVPTMEKIVEAVLASEDGLHRFFHALLRQLPPDSSEATVRDQLAVVLKALFRAL